MPQMLDDVRPDEAFLPGHLDCAGCGATLSMRLALKALGHKTILVVPAYCWSAVDAPPFSTAGVPVMHTPSASAAAAAAGIRAALDVKGDVDTTVCAWAGDGGAFDVGIQALSAAAERNDDVLFVCCDSQANPNTSMQQKDILAIMAAHRIPYAATATVAYPDDFMAKVQRAGATRGTRFLHLLAPCPPAWQILPARTIEYARRAVAARVFPLVEIVDGRHWGVTVDPPAVPLEKYLEGQGRFSGIAGDARRVAAMRAAVEERWDGITSKPQGCGAGGRRC